MIHFSQVVAEGLEAPLDMHLPAGSSAAVFTPHERESEIIIRLIAGFQQLSAGDLLVADVHPQSLSDAQLAAYRRKVGIIYADGGMLSNLNIWENLTLQLAYEGECSTAAIETRAKDTLQLVGFDGPLGRLPARLPLFQLRQIAFARVVLAESNIVVYQSFLDGLSRSEQKQLRLLAEDFHHQSAGKTALFLTSSPESLAGFEFDFIYNRGGISQS
jgi:ABC-type transporter Mla maintaining outer membrane lipid asymmetry ATPase subunit MlaF